MKVFENSGGNASCAGGLLLWRSFSSEIRVPTDFSSRPRLTSRQRSAEAAHQKLVRDPIHGGNQITVLKRRPIAKPVENGGWHQHRGGEIVGQLLDAVR